MHDIQRLKDAFPTRRSFHDLKALCPHCDAFADFAPIADGGFMGKAKPDGRAAHKCDVHLATCTACKAIVVGIIEHNEAFVLYPLESWKHNAPPGIDKHSLSDYEEAIAVLPHSAQCAALLARRSLFRILRTELKVKWDKLAAQIEEAIEHHRVTEQTRQGLRDLIERRLVGPPLDPSPKLKNRSDPGLQLLPLSEHDARYTLQVLEMLMDDLYREKIQRGWSRSRAA
jgi:hypothetical protein